MTQTKNAIARRQFDWVNHYPKTHLAAKQWAVGYGQISPNHKTQAQDGAVHGVPPV